MRDNDDWKNWDVEETTWHPRKPSNKRKRTRADELSEVMETGDRGEGDFNPSFHSSRHEREWIINYLGPFYQDHLITDVVRQVKGGKEATVYCCTAHPATGMTLLAAKVYRPRMFRSLSNDAQYRAGRMVLNSEGKYVTNKDELAAVAKKSSFGKELSHTSWLGHEYQTMRLLWNAGVSVPRPIGSGDSVILMEYIGDEHAAAPTLNGVTLKPDEVEPLFERLMQDVETMLANRRIHGDLSAFNVLYWQGKATIIDFPQTVDPYENPDARILFNRDVKRLCQYFAAYGIDADADEIAADMWSRHIIQETPLALLQLAEWSE